MLEITCGYDGRKIYFFSNEDCCFRSSCAIAYGLHIKNMPRLQRDRIVSTCFPIFIMRQLTKVCQHTQKKYSQKGFFTGWDLSCLSGLFSNARFRFLVCCFIGKGTTCWWRTTTKRCNEREKSVWKILLLLPCPASESFTLVTWEDTFTKSYGISFYA